MASSTLLPVIHTNWADLPPELTSLILHRLGAVEILKNARKVCRSWRRVCRDPSMWREIDMHKIGHYIYYGFSFLENMCRHAIHLSQGDSIEISISDFATDNLLNYIVDSSFLDCYISSNLRSLKLTKCNTTSICIMQALMKLPLLEDLEVSNHSFSGEPLKVVDHSCPNLKTLKINGVHYCHLPESDDFALAIAETMPKLRHLQVFANCLTNVGLNAILDNCPDLEHLDIRQCFNLKIVGDLEKRCSERIKVVRLPNDCFSDYPYDPMFSDIDLSEDEYPYEDRVLDEEFYDDPFDNYYGFLF